MAKNFNSDILFFRTKDIYLPAVGFSSLTRSYKMLGGRILKYSSPVHGLLIGYSSTGFYDLKWE